jgi:hypothetical protein
MKLPITKRDRVTPLRAEYFCPNSSWVLGGFYEMKISGMAGLKYGKGVRGVGWVKSVRPEGASLVLRNLALQYSEFTHPLMGVARPPRRGLAGRGC